MILVLHGDRSRQRSAQTPQIRFNIVFLRISKDKGLKNGSTTVIYTYVRLVDGFPARNLEEKLRECS
jgi:hypothetical protein